MSTICNLSEVLSPAFVLPHRALKSGEVNQIVAKGGRGSAKSSWAGVEGLLSILKNPAIHGVVLRKVSNTLRTSVFAQYVWAIQALRLDHLFKTTVSPMEIQYRPTGQKIMFFGMDDPGKLKSIKVPFGYIGYLHFEELDQFGGDEEIRNVEQSVLRGGPIAIEIKTFNPPRTRDNWANRYCLENAEKPGQLIHASTYLTTPQAWLGERFLADAEYLRKADYDSYAHEYLGEANGTGGAVFKRLEIREITNREIKSFDRIYQGGDFGWFPDPFAFVRVHNDQARNVVYILDEFVRTEQSNEAVANWIRERNYNQTLTTFDSAEPKSIAEMAKMHVRADGAVKGPGSVEHGMKWMARRKIVIDPKRTPNAYKEFLNYEYDRNREGDIISGYPDKNNHTIDAVRYALERVMLSMKTVA